MKTFYLLAVIFLANLALADGSSTNSRFQVMQIPNAQNEQFLLIDTQSEDLWKRICPKGGECMWVKETTERVPSSDVPAAQPSPQAPLEVSQQMSQTSEQPRHEVYAAALMGSTISTTPGSSGNNNFVYSGRLGTDVFSNSSGAFAIGLAVGHDSDTVHLGTVTASGGDTYITTELIGRRLFGSGLYLGGRAGVDLANVTLSASSVSYNSSASAFLVGPVLGYEFPILQQIAIDIDATWMAEGSSTFNFPTLGSVSVESSSGFVFQGGISFHM